jgi:hypothetical protein
LKGRHIILVEWKQVEITSSLPFWEACISIIFVVETELRQNIDGQITDPQNFVFQMVAIEMSISFIM